WPSTCSCWRRAASSRRVRRSPWSAMRGWSRPILARAPRRASPRRGARMAEALLSVRGLAAGYGPAEVLRDIDLEVAAGEVVAVLGSNGAGKSTLNRVISGVLRATRGSIRFAGSAIERATPAAIVARGLIQVPEGRSIFPNLTIAENLDLGSYRRGRPRRQQNRERVFATFPRLGERRWQ